LPTRWPCEQVRVRSASRTSEPRSSGAWTIGEAVKALPDDLKAAHAEVPWPAIAGLRNVVVHEYFRVNPGLVRDIVDQHLAAVTAALDDVEGG
jgi:uncharacterized protein with HEPN domain